MGPVLYALLGVALGAAFAAIAATLYVRAKVAEAIASSGAEVRDAAQRLQAKDTEIDSQRTQHLAHLEAMKEEIAERRAELADAVASRHCAEIEMREARTREATAINRQAELRSEADALRSELEQARENAKTLEIQAANDRSRAERAEELRVKEVARIEEAANQRIEEERQHSSHLRKIQQEQYDRLAEFIEQADEKLGKSFDSVSTKALQLATKELLDLAQKSFGERDEQASQQFAKRKEEFEKLMEPLQKEIAELEELNRSIEEKRAESFGSITQAIANLNKNSESLTNALKKPSIRGSWGEGQLKTILESAGMTEGTHFVVQDTTEEDGKALRTDVVINLPKDRKIIIDSKAPLDKYLAAMDASNEDERKKLCEEHARCVRAHVKDLQKKAYWNRYDGSPPYIILFLPYEAAYQIACDHDKSLLNDAHNAGIILANPMTLMNLVHLASYVMNEERIKHGAEEVRRHGQELCLRLGKVLELIAKHGAHVRLAASSYNDIVGSVDGRLLPSANRMKELGGGAEKVMKPIERIDLPVRQLALPEGDDEPSLAGPEQVTA